MIKRIFFLSNQIVHKISFSLCFWAPDPLIDRKVVIWQKCSLTNFLFRLSENAALAVPILLQIFASHLGKLQIHLEIHMSKFQTPEPKMVVLVFLIKMVKGKNFLISWFKNHVYNSDLKKFSYFILNKRRKYFVIFSFKKNFMIFNCSFHMHRPSLPM